MPSKDGFLSEVRNTINRKQWEGMVFPVDIVAPIFVNFDEIFLMALSYGMIAHVDNKTWEIIFELP